MEAWTVLLFAVVVGGCVGTTLGAIICLVIVHYFRSSIFDQDSRASQAAMLARLDALEAKWHKIESTQKHGVTPEPNHHVAATPKHKKPNKHGNPALDVFISYRAGELHSVASQIASELLVCNFTIFWDKRIMLSEAEFRDHLTESNHVLLLLSPGSLRPLCSLPTGGTDPLLSEIEVALQKPGSETAGSPQLIVVLVRPSILPIEDEQFFSALVRGDTSAFPDHPSGSWPVQSIRVTMTKILSHKIVEMPEESVPDVLHKVTQLLGTKKKDTPAIDDGTGWKVHPSDGQTFKDSVPPRYLRGLPNEAEARRRWQETLEWRAQNKIDDLVFEPQPHYKLMKKYYPHAYLGFSNNHLVYMERAGYANIPELLSQVSIDDCVRHFIYITEICYRVLNPDLDSQCINVLDAYNLGLKDTTGDKMEIFQRISKMTQAHYVERCHLIIVINAGFGFRALWSVASRFVSENTRKKLVVLGSNYKEELLSHVRSDILPKEYGGTSDRMFGDSDIERKILQHLGQDSKQG